MSTTDEETLGHFWEFIHYSVTPEGDEYAQYICRHCEKKVNKGWDGYEYPDEG